MVYLSSSFEQFHGKNSVTTFWYLVYVEGLCLQLLASLPQCVTLGDDNFHIHVLMWLYYCSSWGTWSSLVAHWAVLHLVPQYYLSSLIRNPYLLIGNMFGGCIYKLASPSLKSAIVFLFWLQSWSKTDLNLNWTYCGLDRCWTGFGFRFDSIVSFWWTWSSGSPKCCSNWTWTGLQQLYVGLSWWRRM
jgi:hypothetical protein